MPLKWRLALKSVKYVRKRVFFIENFFADKSFLRTFAPFLIHQTLVKVERMSEDQQKQLRERVLKYALDEFLKHGIKSVKMDDIAASLQMSKRTLYEMFEDKEHLLIESIRMQHQENRLKIEAIAQQADNPLEVFAGVFNMRLNETRGVSPKFLSDLNRYESIRRGFEAEKKTRNSKTLHFIDLCVQQGLFRSDINYALLVRMMDTCLSTMMEQEFYKDFPIEEIYYTLYETLLRSICTEKGREILDNKIKKA